MTTIPKSDNAADGGSSPVTCSPSSDTPETDFVTNDPGTSWYRKAGDLAFLARKLERERNDALSLIAAMREAASAPMAPPGPWFFSAENVQSDGSP